MASWPAGIDAITLFVEDLDAAERFYRDVFDLPIHFEDDASAWGGNAASIPAKVSA